MRKSSVRGMLSPVKKFQVFKMKKPPSLAVFRNSVLGSVIALLLCEPAASPPPLGWNS
jgi:hypothetical protein